MAKRKKKWRKFRHRVVFGIGRHIVKLMVKTKYNAKITKFKAQEKRPYLILANHQTAYDQFFVTLAFKGPLYFVVSEDLLSMGKVSRIIKYLVGIIPIKKQTTDVRAVMNCMQVAQEGGSIAMFPEGNRTFSGKTEYINPAIIPLVKKLKMPIALFRIEGGYGVHPRWSDVVRKGKLTGGVSKVIEPNEYLAMTDEELRQTIEKELFVDDSKDSNEYFHERRAEYLERAVYVCPKCGLSSFYSEGNVIKCLKCGIQAEYTTDKRLKGIDCEFPFQTVNEWYEYQNSFINSTNPLDYVKEPIYQEQAKVSLVQLYKKKIVLDEKASIELFGDKIIMNVNSKENVLPFEDLSAISVLGKNKLNVYYGKEVYQIKGEKRFNAIKYVNMYYRYKNINKGDADGKFLGL